MSGIPFTVYDFFAYLSSGGAVLAALDYSVGKQWLFGDKVALPPALLLILAAYIAGHAVAHVSQYLLETALVSRGLKRPTHVLMARSRPRLRGFFFPGYYKPLEKATHDRVLDQARQRGFDGADEALFAHAYAVVRQAPGNQERLDQFRNIYGFARNMTVSLLVTAVALAFGPNREAHSLDDQKLAVGALMVSFLMLYRYLKFYRQYAYQVLITYAETRPTTGEGKS